jgi:hypothetical protein
VKIGLSGGGVLALAALGVLASVGVFVYFRYGGAIKQTVTETLNPASEKNVVNQGVTAAVSAAVGREESLGGAVADIVFRITHPDFSFTAPVDTARTVGPDGFVPRVPLDESQGQFLSP